MGDVLLGPGYLYRGPVGEPNPDESTIDFKEPWGGNWVNMGDFPEGSPLSVNMAEEVYKVYSEQLTVTLGVTRTRREALITGSLLEHSVANMTAVLQGATATTAAGSSQKGYSDIVLGAQADVTLYKWGVEALRVDDNNANQPVRWFFHKGFMRLTSEIAYAKTKETAIGFEITIIGDLSQEIGEELGLLQIITAAATT